jgi:thioredoxin 1
MSRPYDDQSPSLDEIAALPGATLLEFGTNWCGVCRAMQPRIEAGLAAAPAGLRHLKVEDGPGRALGRAFGVKLWPTLIALRDGREVARAVRPADVRAVERMLAGLAR